MDETAERLMMIGLLLIVAPAIGALLLRWARCPGWPIAGGVMAALLLGPTIAGRIAPDAFERVFVGGSIEQRELELLLRRQQADVLAAQSARVDEQAYRQLQQQHLTEREVAEARLVDARWKHQRPLRLMTIVMVLLAMVACAPFDIRRGSVPQSLPSILSIGLWAAAVPGGLVFAAAVWFWESEQPHAAMVAAALAIGPWALAPGDREAADRAEIGGAWLIQSAGRFASLIAIALVAAILWLAMKWEGIALAAPLLALPLGWILSRAISGRIASLLGNFILLPSLAACAAINLDWIDDFAFWPLIVILMLSGDGRWLGAFIGAMVPGGRSSLRTMRLVVGSMAAGPTQLAIAAIGAHGGIIAPSFVLALVLGAVLIETTTPFRRRFAKRIAQTEEELASLQSNED